MKAFAVLALVVLSAALAAADEHGDYKCKANINEACEAKEWRDLKECSAKYAGALINDDMSVLTKLQKFAIDQLEQSIEFMLRASYFGNYKASRAGFAKVFRGLSDAAWNDAIDVTKLVAERGGDSVFKDKPTIVWNRWATALGDEGRESTIGIEELPSLGRALDSVKHLATEANGIHHRATHHVAADDKEASRHQHDAHIAHYIQEEYSGRYAKEIRTLAGHANDLKQLLLGNECSKKGSEKCTSAPSAREKSLSLFLFDEYLLKL